MVQSGSHERVSLPLPERLSPLVYTPLAPSSRTLAHSLSSHPTFGFLDSQQQAALTNPAVSQQRPQVLSRALVIESIGHVNG
jgi:hypothetical protein